MNHIPSGLGNIARIAKLVDKWLIRDNYRSTPFHFRVPSDTYSNSRDGCYLPSSYSLLHTAQIQVSGSINLYASYGINWPLCHLMVYLLGKAREFPNKGMLRAILSFHDPSKTAKTFAVDIELAQLYHQVKSCTTTCLFLYSSSFCFFFSYYFVSSSYFFEFLCILFFSCLFFLISFLFLSSFLFSLRFFVFLYLSTIKYPSLQQTRAEVLSYLLQPRNRMYSGCRTEREVYSRPVRRYSRTIL